MWRLCLFLLNSLYRDNLKTVMQVEQLKKVRRQYARMTASRKRKATNVSRASSEDSEPAKPAKQAKKEACSMSASTAQARYKIKDVDLRYYGRPASSALDLRKYSVRELEEIIGRQKSFRQAATEERKEAAEIRREERQDQNKETRQECEGAIAAWEDKATLHANPNTKSYLPIDVWGRILEQLCEGLEIEGVRGPSVIARDICNAGRTCKEIHAARIHAFQRLGTLCRPIKESLKIGRITKTYRYGAKTKAEPELYVPEDKIWDAALQDPMSLTLKDLKALHKALDLSGSKPKSVMAIEILEALQLSKPSSVPARLIVAVAKERKEILSSLTTTSADLKSLDNHKIYNRYKGTTTWRRHLDPKFSTFYTRKDCTKNGFHSFQALLAASPGL